MSELEARCKAGVNYAEDSQGLWDGNSRIVAHLACVILRLSQSLQFCLYLAQPRLAPVVCSRLLECRVFELAVEEFLKLNTLDFLADRFNVGLD